MVCAVRSELAGRVVAWDDMEASARYAMHFFCHRSNFGDARVSGGPFVQVLAGRNSVRTSHGLV